MSFVSHSLDIVTLLTLWFMSNLLTTWRCCVSAQATQWGSFMGRSERLHRGRASRCRWCWVCVFVSLTPRERGPCEWCHCMMLMLMSLSSPSFLFLQRRRLSGCQGVSERPLVELSCTAELSVLISAFQGKTTGEVLKIKCFYMKCVFTSAHHPCMWNKKIFSFLFTFRECVLSNFCFF